MQITTETFFFLQYCLDRAQFLFLHSGSAVQLLHEEQTLSSNRRPCQERRRPSASTWPSAAPVWTEVSGRKRLFLPPPPNWSSAAASRLSARTARWPTSRRWTGRIPPWSPACSSAGRCGRCFRSAWNKSATGWWPCYRLNGRKKNQVRGTQSSWCDAYFWHVESKKIQLDKRHFLRINLEPQTGTQNCIFIDHFEVFQREWNMNLHFFAGFLYEITLVTIFSQCLVLFLQTSRYLDCTTSISRWHLSVRKLNT